MSALLRTTRGSVAGVVDVPGDTLAYDGRGFAFLRDDLLRGDKGVVMVVGVFFTFLWIGLAWAIFGMGNAITYREQLQNAADASAFAAAVYDARGMNLLASINIVMGVVLAILIVAHVVQLGVLVVESAKCLPCVPKLTCGYGWAKCPDACAQMGKANGIVADVDKVVHAILPVLHDVEVGIAVGWPWVASGKSTTLGGAYFTHGVALTSSFAWSQIPWSADNELSSLTKNFGDFGGASSSDGNTSNTRYGLPVSSDKYSNLCTVAVIDVTHLGGLVNLPSIITSGVNDAGNWFCDADADSSAVRDAIEIASDVLLPCKIYGGFPGFGSPFPSLPPSDNTQGLTPEAKSAVKDSDTSQSPMMIYPPAKMGYDYFGVWSTAVGKFTDPVTQQVGVAGLESQSGPAVVAALPPDALLGIAKSEFYYDPIPGDTVDSETKIDPTTSWPIKVVMWNPRWRARLRRYHYIPGLLGDLDAAAGFLLTANFTKAAETAVSDALNGDSMTNILGQLTGGPTNVDTYTNPTTPGVFH